MLDGQKFWLNIERLLVAASTLCLVSVSTVDRAKAQICFGGECISEEGTVEEEFASEDEAVTEEAVPSPDFAVWNRIKDSGDPIALRKFVSNFPNSEYFAEAEQALHDVLTQIVARLSVGHGFQHEQEQAGKCDALWSEVSTSSEPEKLEEFIYDCPGHRQVLRAQYLLKKATKLPPAILPPEILDPQTGTGRVAGLPEGWSLKVDDVLSVQAGTGGVANLRNAPNGDRIGQLPTGSFVWVLETTHPDWVSVHYQVADSGVEIQGYLHRSVVRFERNHSPTRVRSPSDLGEENSSDGGRNGAAISSLVLDLNHNFEPDEYYRFPADQVLRLLEFGYDVQYGDIYKIISLNSENSTITLRVPKAITLLEAKLYELNTVWFTFMRNPQPSSCRPSDDVLEQYRYVEILQTGSFSGVFGFNANGQLQSFEPTLSTGSRLHFVYHCRRENMDYWVLQLPTDVIFQNGLHFGRRAVMISHEALNDHYINQRLAIVDVGPE